MNEQKAISQAGDQQAPSKATDKPAEDKCKLTSKLYEAPRLTAGLPSATMNAAESHLNAVLSNYKYLSIIPLDIDSQPSKNDEKK